MSNTIIITGASDGIGAAAARRLHQDGHRVVVVGRSAHKTQAVAREIGADPFVGDFTRLQEVRALAETRPGTDWESGTYYEKRKPAKHTNSQARDADLAHGLWERSEQLIG